MSIPGEVGSVRATVYEPLDLGKQYRPIGISAVAAALASSGEHSSDARAQRCPGVLRPAGSTGSRFGNRSASAAAN